ncbi:hypothetical protein D4764_11G0004610 [Takifugu flavidus]|uniref:Uncharacterized protein n=1 Tax=Takifugu flavidus TaxID=433684 RepID=A0A5C6PJB5_9TELE|nr:hypothetical protein D4764_11G0004610 [Takifugu flavidus]
MSQEGPLGACQQASLPATSGAGRMERALVSALKVNEAAARHSASDSWAPPLPHQYGERQTTTNHTHDFIFSQALSARPGCNIEFAAPFSAIH